MDTGILPSHEARRLAHRRVGIAATLAFVALLLLGAMRGPAQAAPVTPAATPVPTPAVVPSQPPEQPAGPVPGFRRDHDGDRDGGLRPGPGGGAPDGEGGGMPDDGGGAPAPSTSAGSDAT